MAPGLVLALILLLPIALAAQTARIVTPSDNTPSVITMDEEPHHHLMLKNDVVKVFEVNLAPRDAMAMHRRDYDEIVVVIGDGITVSTTPGQPDILRMSKNGQMSFERGGELSVRNIGQTEYRGVSINLLRTQTGGRNLCGKQIPDMKLDCPTASENAKAPRADVPQFETDQTRVTLTTIRPHQYASLGEADRDELIVAIDGAAMAVKTRKGPDQALAPGGTIWIGRGSAKRVLKNISDNEGRAVTVAFKP
jgi:quercetin dioxygenase-like cupin family protein